MVKGSCVDKVITCKHFNILSGQQAIGMTVNFVNRSTMEELTIEEISGIAFIYNQVRFILLNLSEIILSCPDQSNKCVIWSLLHH